MGHRPYPNADRALHQVRRGHIAWMQWVQPEPDCTPWIIAPARIDASTLKMPRVPEGWSAKATENLRSISAALRQDHPGGSS